MGGRTVTELPPRVARLFHNYAVRTIDAERDRQLVILTVLAYGEWEDIQWLFRTYGWDAVRDVVARDLQTVRSLPPSVLNLWSIVFWGKPLRPPEPRERWAPTRGPEPPS